MVMKYVRMGFDAIEWRRLREPHSIECPRIPGDHFAKAPV